MWLILTPFPSIETQKKREEKYRFWTILTAGWNEFKIYTLYKTRTVYLRWSIKIKSFRPILAQTLCFRIRCTLCLALLWSFRKPKFTHLQCECIESVRVCVCVSVVYAHWLRPFTWFKVRWHLQPYTSKSIRTRKLIVFSAYCPNCHCSKRSIQLYCLLTIYYLISGQSRYNIEMLSFSLSEPLYIHFRHKKTW